MKNILLALSMVISLFTVAPANAELINGTVSFSGVSETTIENDVITAIDFAWDFGLVPVTTGDFSGWNLPFAKFTDLDPVQATDSLWSFAGFTFDLENITDNYLKGTTASLTGTGTVSGNGFDDTFYTWTYTTQYLGDDIWTTFSASAVPAPAGIALLGFALLGFGATRRNKKS